ncbi:MAG TPA: hypothetical protein PLR83_09615 [Pyrinomonadaceae bacterium]|nr:hypothetical protein [Pyrinomonadaceae bacterium]
MKSKDRNTLAAVFRRPVSANIKWAEIESLFKALGAEISQAEGSRVRVFFSVRYESFIGHIHDLRPTKVPWNQYASGSTSISILRSSKNEERNEIWCVRGGDKF